MLGFSACGAIKKPADYGLTDPVNTPSITDIPTLPPEWERSGWKLIWQEEFEGSEINLKNWTFDIGGDGWGNNELEFYKRGPENVRLINGLLVIEARAESFGGRDFTSARLKTQGLQSWTYGRFESRIKIPAGQGVWPAFWMLGEDIAQIGWPDCGEIDILENIGKEPNRVHASAHSKDYFASHSLTGSMEIDTPLSEDFHIYAIEWDENEIRWFLDEEEYFHISKSEVPGGWAFNKPFFIILNLAIGGNWPGAPDETTIFPKQMLVDYVRVYQRSD
ncbi:MAG TPA: glycoside hydrolase family 16 protein [Dehalococcoidales bacterium]|nr:glycoside hydrolase family 16 protein [Dehalococcoidales bacterium]